MFKHLTDFAYRRSALEALGFYLAYGVLVSITFAVLGGLIAALLQLDLQTPHAKDQMRLTGNIIAVILSIGMASIVLHKKGQLHGKGIAMLILTLFISIFLGGLASFALVAYLTTWESTKGREQENAEE